MDDFGGEVRRARQARAIGDAWVGARGRHRGRGARVAPSGGEAMGRGRKGGARTRAVIDLEASALGAPAPRGGGAREAAAAVEAALVPREGGGCDVFGRPFLDDRVASRRW